MGTMASITVLSERPEEHVADGQQILAHLHFLWSRFVESSDISRINNADGSTVHVAPETTRLVQSMKTAHSATNGYYNPTLLPLQHQFGDNMSLDGQHSCGITPHARPYDSLDEIEIIDINTVRLPHDMTLDAGGIGKGLAADLVVTHLLSTGAMSASVNIGGDIRVGSAADYGHDWNIDVLDFNKTVVSTISLRNGAIATSASNARTSSPSHIEMHILSISNDLDHRKRSASVISSDAMWAEVWTKNVMLSSDPFADIEPTGQAAMLVIDGSLPIYSSLWKEYQL